MSVENLSAENRQEFNLTTGSTIQHLIAVLVTCAALWGVIVATIFA